MFRWPALYILMGCWLVLAGSNGYAQAVIRLRDSTDLARPTNLYRATQVYRGPFRDSLRYETMLRGPWTEAGTGSLYTAKKDFTNAGWLRFTVQNTHPHDTLRLLYYGGSDLLTTAYFFDGDALLDTYLTGWMRRASPPAWAWSADNYAIPVVVPPGTKRTVWVNKIYFYAPGNQLITDTRLLTVSGYEAFRAATVWHVRFIILFIGFILCVCLFLCVSGLVQFITTRDSTYIWWAVYLAGMFLFFFRTFELHTNTRSLSNLFPGYFILSLGMIQSTNQLGYFLFFDAFLNVRHYSLILHRTIRVFLLVLVGFWCYNFTVFFQSGINISHTRMVVTNGMDACTLVFVLMLLVALVRRKIPLSGYLIAGSACVYTGLFAVFYINRVVNNHANFYPWDLPSFYFGVGVLIELFLFSIALSARMRLAEAEKNRLQRTYAVSLETELARRGQETQAQNRLLEDELLQRLTNEFDQKIAETEMAALRAQMNPHFIFNCLNSIQYFTAQNDAEKASDYLTKFSRLIRLVLENSRSERVTLANELETLRLYLDMEAMRFGQKVHYEISIIDFIDADDIQIPPLLLQPFVENAIWHGLMHKDEGGTVRVVVAQPRPDYLCITITDDGVGRAKAAEYKSKSATKSKSFGLKMTADRIALINQLYHTQTQVQVDDLTDAQGRATGTRVVVEIPV